MKAKRSTYTFTLNCDSTVVNQLINSFLEGNNFKLTTTKKGETVYKSGDAMLGYTGFLYNYDGHTLTITAWLMGALGDFPVEQNSLNMLAMNYRNQLGKLFDEINKLKNQREININNNYTNQNIQNQNIQQNQNIMGEKQSQPIQQTYQQPSSQQFAQTFQDETTKKQEKMCEIGFWISIFGLFCSFMGVAFGVIIYIIDFYFASQGLKTRKKGKAIATIVLSIISILIVILQLIGA